MISIIIHTMIGNTYYQSNTSGKSSVKSIKTINPSGTIMYRNEDGYFHREDGPAVIWPNGTKEYWINGELHREDGPAIILYDGYKEYWLNDFLYDYEAWIYLTQNPISKYWRKYCEL